MLKNKKLKIPVPKNIQRSRGLILKSFGSITKMTIAVSITVIIARTATICTAVKPAVCIALVKRPMQPHIVAASKTEISPKRDFSPFILSPHILIFNFTTNVHIFQ